MSLPFERETSERSSRVFPGRRVRMGGRCCPVLSDCPVEFELCLRPRLRLLLTFSEESDTEEALGSRDQASPVVLAPELGPGIPTSMLPALLVSTEPVEIGGSFQALGAPGVFRSLHRVYQRQLARC